MNMSNDNNNISKPEVIIQKGKVVSTCKEFLLKGDELLASKLQDEEFHCKYDNNRKKTKEIRENIPIVKKIEHSEYQDLLMRHQMLEQMEKEDALIALEFQRQFIKEQTNELIIQQKLDKEYAKKLQAKEILYEDSLVDYRNIDLSNKLASDLNINETSNQEVYTTNNNDDDDEDEDEDLKLAKHLQKEEENKLKAKLRAETADEKLAREIYEHEMKLKHNQELEIQCQPSIPSSSKSSSHLTANPFENKKREVESLKSEEIIVYTASNISNTSSLSSSQSSLYSLNANLLALNKEFNQNRKEYSSDNSPAATMPVETKVIQIETSKQLSQRLRINSSQQIGNEYEQDFLIDLCDSTPPFTMKPQLNYIAKSQENLVPDDTCPSDSANSSTLIKSINIVEEIDPTFKKQYKSQNNLNIEIKAKKESTLNKEYIYDLKTDTSGYFDNDTEIFLPVQGQKRINGSVKAYKKNKKSQSQCLHQ